MIDQLFESEIFIQIGERHFQIPKDIFSDPGNSPNFFSLGFAVFFSTSLPVSPVAPRKPSLSYYTYFEGTLYAFVTRNTEQNYYETVATSTYEASSRG